MLAATTTNEPQPDIPVLFLFLFFSFLFFYFFFFFFWMVYARGCWYRLSLSLAPRLLVTSKITTRKTYVKDSMMSTQERTLTERHAEYNDTNTMCRCTQLQYDLQKCSRYNGARESVMKCIRESCNVCMVRKISSVIPVPF